MTSKPPNDEPKKQGNYWMSIGLMMVLIPGIFWLKFGRVDGYVIGFTVFLIMLVSAAQFLPGLATEYEKDAPPVDVKPRKIDKLGIVWFLLIPFAPFFSWVISELFTITVENWRTILAIKATLCVLLPCICVLPLTRYLNRRIALVATFVLVIGTCFPVIIGWNSMRDLIDGPKEREVVVTDVRTIMYTRNFHETPTDIKEITLDDGRVFQANKKYVSVSPGERTLIMLEHVEVVLEVR